MVIRRTVWQVYLPIYNTRFLLENLSSDFLARIWRKKYRIVMKNGHEVFEMITNPNLFAAL
jgi:hypothetical protein